MSTNPRPPRPLARQELEFLDDRIFVIATEDTYASKQYFASLRLPRLKIHVLESQGGRCSPEAALIRVRDLRKKYNLLEDDECWLVLDTNHWIEPNHIAGTTATISQARQIGVSIAFSNPCFELWLLLHHYELLPTERFSNCSEVIARLKGVVGGYDKTYIRTELFPWPMIRQAIERAEVLDANNIGPWPQSTGTHVYKLVKQLMAASRPPMK